MPYDRRVSVEFSPYCITAWALWLAGAVIVICNWPLGIAADGSGDFGIMLIAGGHMLVTMRTLSRQRDREISAFELGRESALRVVQSQR